MTIEGANIPDQNDLEVKREWLDGFFNRLWQASVENHSGKKAKVILPPLEGMYDATKVPFIETDLSPQVGRGMRDWSEITKRLLVLTKDRIDRINLHFYDEVISRYNVPLILDSEGKHTFTLKYSDINGVADTETNPNKASHFPSNHEQGRPTLNFRVIELFDDNRRKLGKLMEDATSDDQRLYDKFFLSELKESEAAQNPSLKEILGRLESTPLTIVELVGRVTFYDVNRRTPQPINIAGIRVTQTLDHKVTAEFLTPWIGHRAWASMPEHIQRPVRSDYDSGYPILDANLDKLIKIFTSPKKR